jgi:dUTP pyrophosphatase
MKIGIHKINDYVQLPEFATEFAACFDLRANFGPKCEVVKGFNAYNKPIERYAMTPKNVSDRSSVEAREISINSGDRLLVPTGIIMDIPQGESIRLHPRSGLSLKKGLILANSEGIIDADYVEQVYVLLTNSSSESVVIQHGERICQAEIMPVIHPTFEFCEKPDQKTSRTGGFGSTGEK